MAILQCENSRAYPQIKLIVEDTDTAGERFKIDSYSALLLPVKLIKVYKLDIHKSIQEFIEDNATRFFYFK
jgi:hypothetical protein